jgi:hypothetical protein
MNRLACMNRTLVFSFCFLLLLSCDGGKKIPDVSGVKVDLQVKRFDQDFFRIDTTDMYNGLVRIRNTYPNFYGVFMNSVLGIQPVTVTGPAGTELEATPRRELSAFLSSYRPIYDSVQAVFGDIGWLQRDLTDGFRFVKHYFPDYKVPPVYTVIGPINALANMGGTYTPNFLGPDFIGIGMQFYLGRNYSLYGNDRFIAEVAPRYRSARFSKEYIVPEVMQLVADDIYPNKTAGLTLVEQMVERGKQWFLLDHFLPRTADSLKTGYTGKQVEWVEENEGAVWAYLVKNENLYSIDPETIQAYLGEGPNTRGLPELSPGNIGQWVGWRIVAAYAAKNGKLGLKEILNTPARTIFDGSGYRPK